jgi:hypothetical protein
VSTQIKVLIEDIRRQSQVLSSKFLKDVAVQKMNQILVDIVGAATSGSFESKSRVALNKYDMQLAKLFQSSARLITLFEDGFFRAYPPS